MKPHTAVPTSSDPPGSATDLPSRCEVLVVGAGPAGSACAHWLARHGLDVVLADQHDFPRDKVCGDGLIPDAHAVLARLGALDEVLARARHVSHVRCVGPSGGRIDVPGTLAVLPRRQLDLLLVRHAQAQGARLATPLRFESVLEDQGRVIGARLRRIGSPTVHIVHANWVVLATGAATPAMLAAGLCERRSPSGVAVRAHVRHPDLARRHGTMDVVWHRALRPGYGWIFPCRDDVFNIGVGTFFGRRQGAKTGQDGANLRHMFDDFVRVHAPAQALLQGGEWVSELKGAPLRCTLAGARSGRPGLLATGEAIGSTYDFTGEGIGKALETGLLAAESLLQGRARQHPDADTLADYARRLASLQPRFSLYEKANRINRHPWLADLVIWRAQRSQGLLRRMTGVLNETSNPGKLLSVQGMLRLMLD